MTSPPLGTTARDTGDTFTLDKMREALRQFEEFRLPTFIVTTWAIEGRPVEHDGMIVLTPNDARELHRQAPLILDAMLSPNAGRYRLAGPFSGPFPLEPRWPPYDRMQP
jgi:hypothetical protein